MSAPVMRVVPTLTEVLDESALRPAAPIEPVSESLHEPVPATVLMSAAPAMLDEALAFEPMREPERTVAELADFDLDLGLGPAPEAAAPPPWGDVAEARPGPPPTAEPVPALDGAFFDSLETSLRQRVGLTLGLAVDALLQQGLREGMERIAQRLAQELQAELQQQFAPQLEALVQQALHEALRQERERLPR